MDRRTFFSLSTASVALIVSAAASRPFRNLIGISESEPQGGESQRVAVSAFGSGMAALQRAMDTAAHEVVIDTDVVVAKDVLLRSDQLLRFAGGRIRVAANAKIIHGVFYAGGGRNMAVLDAAIDASAKPAGVVGIKLVNVDGARIEGGRLTRSSLWFESNDNSVDRRMVVADLTIDMAGARETAIYLSGVRGVTIRNS